MSSSQILLKIKYRLLVAEKIIQLKIMKTYHDFILVIKYYKLI